jgi:mannitol-specific phosphotransferase system IIBC component
MENGERLTAEEARAILGGMNEIDFSYILREKQIPAYRIHDGGWVPDVNTLLENERWRALPPGPYNQGLWSTQQVARMAHHIAGRYLPLIDAKMIHNVLSVLFLKRADVEAYRDNMPIAEKQRASRQKKQARAQAFDDSLSSFAKKKKYRGLSIPDIARRAIRQKEDFLYELKPKRKEPKQETIEKHLRNLRRLGKA